MAFARKFGSRGLHLADSFPENISPPTAHLALLKSSAPGSMGTSGGRGRPADTDNHQISWRFQTAHTLDCASTIGREPAALGEVPQPRFQRLLLRRLPARTQP